MRPIYKTRKPSPKEARTAFDTMLSALDRAPKGNGHVWIGRLGAEAWYKHCGYASVEEFLLACRENPDVTVIE